MMGTDPDPFKDTDSPTVTRYFAYPDPDRIADQ